MLKFKKNLNSDTNDYCGYNNFCNGASVAITMLSIIFTIIIGIFIYGFVTILEEPSEQTSVEENRFIVLDHSYSDNTEIVYDTYTRVEYIKSNDFFEMLVDAEGKPLLYEGE